MRASCFCSWSVCRRSCSAPTVFCCWSASTPFMMPSSLDMTGSNFWSSFFSISSPTASRMTFACSERRSSSFLSSFCSNLPNAAFKSALVAKAFVLFGSFSIYMAYTLDLCRREKLSTHGRERCGWVPRESDDFCPVHGCRRNDEFYEHRTEQGRSPLPRSEEHTSEL